MIPPSLLVGREYHEGCSLQRKNRVSIAKKPRFSKKIFPEESQRVMSKSKNDLTKSKLRNI
jgi:hypothetical protein